MSIKEPGVVLPTQTKAWVELQEHYHDSAEVKCRDLFESDPKRFEQFSLQVGDILFDYSKQLVTKDTVEKLCALAESVELNNKIKAIFSGEIVNRTENQAALHTALRDFSLNPVMVKGQDVKDKVQAELQKMAELAEAIHLARRLGSTGIAFTDVLCLGIGGSELGPALVCEALDGYKVCDLKFHFISNVFGQTLAECLRQLNPETTLCLISSKSFTTPETLRNAVSVQQWYKSRTLSAGHSFDKHLLAVTAHKERAMNFGILEENIFEFWEWVGGRYSIWSAVGLPVLLKIGVPHFMSFLRGARLMDSHFYTAAFEQNMPVLMALLGIWNTNFLNTKSHAILPYDDRLRLFPAYLQQLEMESNGKSINEFLLPVDYSTAPVVWGGIGCNGQHAFMQLLHQGTEIIPVDFLVAAKGDPEFKEQHQLLVASCLSQSKALMEGQNDAFFSESDPIKAAKLCSGNRPSSTLFYSELTPQILGSLIALYEHKVFVQGVIWGINSFDQWGVELGKRLAKNILPNLEKDPNEFQSDSSTKGLIRFFQEYAE